jgi:hypothetical protein
MVNNHFLIIMSFSKGSKLEDHELIKKTSMKISPKHDIERL